MDNIYHKTVEKVTTYAPKEDIFHPVTGELVAVIAKGNIEYRLRFTGEDYDVGVTDLTIASVDDRYLFSFQPNPTLREPVAMFPHYKFALGAKHVEFVSK